MHSHYALKRTKFYENKKFAIAIGHANAIDLIRPYCVGTLKGPQLRSENFKSIAIAVFLKSCPVQRHLLDVFPSWITVRKGVNNEIFTDIFFPFEPSPF